MELLFPSLGPSVPAWVSAATGFPPGAPLGGTTSLGWNSMVLPYMEQDNIWRLMNPRVGAYVSGVNRNQGANRVALFLCPSYNQERSSSTIDNATSTTTRVLPSQRPRESPRYSLMGLATCGLSVVGMTRCEWENSSRCTT